MNELEEHVIYFCVGHFWEAECPEDCPHFEECKAGGEYPLWQDPEWTGTDVEDHEDYDEEGVLW